VSRSAAKSIATSFKYFLEKKKLHLLQKSYDPEFQSEFLNKIPNQKLLQELSLKMDKWA